MTEDFSEAAIRANCPHCDTSSHAFDYPLETTAYFYVVCDPHPLAAGHLLIIPKAHLSCIAEYDEGTLQDFKGLHDKAKRFVEQNYDTAAVFEHGVFGQTVFHSHVHYLPYDGLADGIIPEGNDYLTDVASIDELHEAFVRDNGYLFFGIAEQMWTVDATLAVPRFFRDRFAAALGKPERGNWKQMRQDVEMMEKVKQECLATQKAWNNFAD